MLRRAADEHDDAAAVGDVGGEVKSVPQQMGRPLQVKHTVPKPRAQQELGHVGVQRSLAVAEVDPGVEQVGHGEQAAHGEVVRVAQRVRLGRVRLRVCRTQQGVISEVFVT